MYAQAAAPDSEGVFNELARNPGAADVANDRACSAGDLVTVL
jgi:hypothetical protein